MQCVMQLKYTCLQNQSLSTEVVFKGTLYKKGSFLCLKRESDESINFGKIELVFVKDDRGVFSGDTTHFIVFVRVWTL